MADVKVDMAFQAIECCACGVMFMAPEGYATYLKDHGLPIHCPNGHRTGFGGVPMAEQLAAVTAERDALAIDLADALRTVIQHEDAERLAKQRKARGRK